jgi:hypothetical protein
MKTYKNQNIAEKPLLGFLLFFIMIAMTGSCGSSSRQTSKNDDAKTGNIKTESIVFQCDKIINQGMLLPVDVIYITKYRMPRAVISIGPNRWFNSLEREQWETKQTLSLKGGETKTLNLNKLWLEDTVLLIIFANFKDVKDPDSQQIIIDESRRPNEKILVMPQSLTVEYKK